jgi:hypothetical protein
MGPQTNAQVPPLSDPREDEARVNLQQDSAARHREDGREVEQPKVSKKGVSPEITRQLLNALLASGVAALVGGMVNWSIAHYSGRQQSVQLAVSILREPLQDDEKKGELSPLRDWAVDVVNKLSVVPFSEDAAKLLRTGQRTLPHTEEAYPPLTGYCEVTPLIAKVGERVTFTAHGAGGNNEYVFTWVGDDGVESHDYRLIVIYRTPGRKEASVRITGNGEFAYRTASVLIISAEPDANVKADVIKEN